MKKTLLLAAALAVLSVGIANAQVTGQPPGVNLSWNDCDASMGSTGENIAATCASNTVPSLRNLIGSYIAPPVTAINANDWILDIQTDTKPLPCWWNFTVAPRNVQWAMNAVSPPGTGNCMDYFGGSPGGPAFASAVATVYPFPTGDPSLGRVRFQGTEGISADLAPTVIQPAVGDEVYSFTFQVKPGSTLGTTCLGCLSPACFVLNQLIISQTGAPTLLINFPSSRNYVLWRGGGTPNPCPLGPPATPTVNKTWGSLKTLYR